MTTQLLGPGRYTTSDIDRVNGMGNRNASQRGVFFLPSRRFLAWSHSSTACEDGQRDPRSATQEVHAKLFDLVSEITMVWGNWDVQSAPGHILVSELPH
jgi:hypothetical protein